MHDPEMTKLVPLTEWIQNEYEHAVQLITIYQFLFIPGSCIQRTIFRVLEGFLGLGFTDCMIQGIPTRAVVNGRVSDRTGWTPSQRRARSS